MSNFKITGRGRIVLVLASVVAAAFLVPVMIRGFCLLIVAVSNVIPFI
jgi:hypothetical protein